MGPPLPSALCRASPAVGKDSDRPAKAVVLQDVSGVSGVVLQDVSGVVLQDVC